MEAALPKWIRLTGPKGNSEGRGYHDEDEKHHPLSDSHENAMLYAIDLGTLCSSNLSHIPEDSLLRSIQSLLATAPEQVRWCRQGRHSVLCDAICNVTCPPFVVELLLQADQRLGLLLDDLEKRSCHYAVDQVDADGMSLAHHVLQQLHLGLPFALSKMELILRYSHRKPHISISSEILIQLLSRGCRLDLPDQTQTEDTRLVCLTRVLELLLDDESLDPTQVLSKTTGCTPLHLAVRNFSGCSPVSVAVVNLCSKHSAGGDILVIRNVSGDLPLHIACRAGVSLDVLRMILDRTVATSRSLCTSSDHSVSKLLLSVNKEGYSPIHMAWIHHLESSNQPVFSNMRQNELDDGTERRSAIYTSLVEKVVNQVISDFGGPVLERQNHVESMLGELITRTFMLIRVAADIHHPSQIDDAHILHCAASLASSKTMPMALLNLILWQYPHQAHVSDRFGKLPLHYALDSSREFQSVGRSDQQRARDWMEWVGKLCDLNRHACFAVDSEGRLPLHYALDYPSPSGRGASDARDAIVRELVSKCPQSVEYPETQTKLLPFMLAASNPCFSLTTVFEILRQSPNAMQSD